MYEAVFSVEGGTAYEAATDATDTTIDLWCNDHCDLLQVSGPDSDVVLDDIDDTVGIGNRLNQRVDRVLITVDCLKAHMDDNIERFLAQHDCILVPPLRYVAGRKRVRVLSLEGDALSSLYRDLATELSVTVETKRSVTTASPDSPLMPVDALVPDLSDRQYEAFVTAYEKGYYELPRETTTEEIAAEVDVHRRTLEEHLRLAERKIAEAIVEYL